MAVAERVLNTSKIWKAVMVDVCILAFVYFIPTLSHITAVPIYYFEPMRIALFISILFLRDYKNAYVLAFTLPIFSFLVAGHPIAVKNVIMAIELFLNVWLLCKLLDRKVNTFLSCLISIVLSKVLYYGMKYSVITAGWLNIKMIDTSILVQIVIATILSVFFWVVYRK